MRKCHLLRCKWCNDILDLGEPTKEQLKLEAECPWKENHKEYEILAEWKGQEYADAYKEMNDRYIKENLE